MPDPANPKPSQNNVKPTLLGQVIDSPVAGAVARFPPVAWLLRKTASAIIHRQLDEAAQNHPQPAQSTRADLQSALEGIVRDLVDVFGYAGAMISPYEQGDVLPVRAVYVDPHIASMEQVRAWEQEINARLLSRGLLSRGLESRGLPADRPVSLTNPEVARVYLHRGEFQRNLSVLAANAGRPVTSSSLFDLFTPIAPDVARDIIQGIQEALGIKQVIAVPFFLDSTPEEESGRAGTPARRPPLLDNENYGTNPESPIPNPELPNNASTHHASPSSKEYVGNLFVAKRGLILESDENLLGAFGRQVAAAILGERRRMQAESIQRLILDMQRSLKDEQRILERIVQGVVEDLGYAGAMVATYEPGDDALPVRAIYVNPRITSMEQIHAWEKQVGASLPPDRPVSLSDPEIARVYVHDPAYQDNLSVKAAQAGRPVTSDQLFDLFTPVAPQVSEAVVQGVQDALRIHQVIAAPFFLEAPEEDSGRAAIAELRIPGRRNESPNDEDGGQGYRGTEFRPYGTNPESPPPESPIPNNELPNNASPHHSSQQLIGNLFAATQSEKFNSWEIELLQAFGQQAAVGLRNARLYKQSEDRRMAGEILGRMAFSASASVHAFRNHIGVVRGNLALLNKLDVLAKDEEGRRKLLEQLTPPVMERLNQVSDILDRLHTPWQLTSNELVDVNQCLRRALHKITQDPEGWVRLSLAEELPCVRTSPDMLTEAFRVIIKNSVEAMAEKGGERWLTIESRLQEPALVEVLVRDNGTGIKKENLSRIFEMRWTTKSAGLGFGLFWAKDYIEGLGGRITVESVWQQGTTFRITLPGAEE